MGNKGHHGRASRGRGPWTPTQARVRKLSAPTAVRQVQYRSSAPALASKTFGRSRRQRHAHRLQPCVHRWHRQRRTGLRCTQDRLGYLQGVGGDDDSYEVDRWAFGGLSHNFSLGGKPWKGSAWQCRGHPSFLNTSRLKGEDPWIVSILNAIVGLHVLEGAGAETGDGVSLAGGAPGREQRLLVGRHEAHDGDSHEGVARGLVGGVQLSRDRS